MCRCRCSTNFTAEERAKILDDFNSIADHEKQNIYLRGCVTVKESTKIRRRPRKNDAKERSSFSYTITTFSHSVRVCKASFAALHGIKISRLKRKVLNFSADIADKRGKHNKHYHISDDVKARIRNHISQFPARESHYSRTNNKTRKYLDASLNIAKLYKMFLKDNPDLKDVVRYSLYREIFNFEFSISFGFPRSDICDTCELFSVKIKAAERAENETEAQKLKDEHALHLRKADVFYTHLAEVTEAARADADGSTGVIAMDFQKNLPLPKTGISQEYYKRQLWLHNFCIHDSVTETAKMYLYAEHYAGKGPNEVISCLSHYISTMPKEITTLHIFCDNCFSQNKNRYLMAYLCHVVDRNDNNLQEIHVQYPIPGHSRMPCDRDFGRIEQKQQKRHNVCRPSEYVEMIKEANKIHPFEVVYVQHPVTDDMESDGTPIVNVNDYKRALDTMIKAPAGIAKYRGLLFARGNNGKSRTTMTGDCTENMKLLKRGVKKAQINQAIRHAKPAFVGFNPIKMAKYNDVQKLLEYTNIDDSVKFYQHLKGSIQAKEVDDDFE